MFGVQFNNEATHGIGECPACGAPIHVVGSLAEQVLRWACVQCLTVGSAPLSHLTDALEEEDSEDERPALLQ
jgi:hypothetical protein